MWIAVGITLVLVGGYLIYTVIIKKFPQLKLIDLSTLAKERHAQVKSRIMRDRFDRSVGEFQSKTSTAAGRVRGRISTFYEGLYGRLKKMEREYDDQTPLASEDRGAKIAKLLAEADRSVEEEKYEEAEKRYIEVLRLDPHQVEVYRGLADIYIDQKAYDQAKETLEFLLKLNSDDARALSRLGEIEASRGNLQEAEDRYRKSIAISGDVSSYRVELGKIYLLKEEAEKAYEEFGLALEVEPYNPKYLDYFLETSILVGNVKAANEAFETLETANPDNQKLDDFRQRIKELKKK